MESFSVEHYCRFCTGKSSDIQLHSVASGAFELRTKELHQAHVKQVEDTGTACFGMKRLCVFTKYLSHFHVIFCKVCVLSVSNVCVCLPCVVACLFPCLVLVLTVSRHVLSYVCLSMPCALLLLSVSPPLTCSQSPGLFVLLVSPVSC